MADTTIRVGRHMGNLFGTGIRVENMGDLKTGAKCDMTPNEARALAAWLVAAADEYERPLDKQKGSDA